MSMNEIRFPTIVNGRVAMKTKSEMKSMSALKAESRASDGRWTSGGGSEESTKIAGHAATASGNADKATKAATGGTGEMADKASSLAKRSKEASESHGNARPVSAQGDWHVHHGLQREHAELASKHEKIADRARGLGKHELANKHADAGRIHRSASVAHGKTRNAVADHNPDDF